MVRSCGDDDLGWGREKEHNAAEVSCSAASRIREMKQVSCRRLRAQWLETGFSCCFIFLLFWCYTQSYGGGLGRNIQTNGFVGQCLVNDFGPRDVNGLRWSFEEHFWSSVCWGTTRKCIYLCAVWSTGLIRTLNQTGSALIASGKNGWKNIKSAINKKQRMQILAVSWCCCCCWLKLVAVQKDLNCLVVDCVRLVRSKFNIQ